MDPTWLAWPTLRIGGGQTKSAGAYYHRDAMRQVMARHGTLVMAELRIETTGEYVGAVRVFVAGEMLGSIPHEGAEKFRQVVSELASRGMASTCRAELECDEWTNVWLDVRPEPRPETDPFLPPLGSFDVSLKSGEAKRLDEALHSKAKNKRVVTVGRLTHASTGWGLTLDGKAVGVIQERIPAVEAAQAAGFPLSCQVRILREEGKGLRVCIDVPRNDI